MSQQHPQQFAFARTSSVPSAGKDFENSARHRRNIWTTLKEAEETGAAEQLVTRDRLLKSEPPQLLTTIKPDTAMAHLAAFLILKTFPPTPYQDKNYSDYIRSQLPAQNRNAAEFAKIQKKIREQYYESFCGIKQLVEKESQTNTNPTELIQKANNWTRARIIQLRKNDYFNPVANSLCSFQKRLRVRASKRYKANEVGAKLIEFTTQIEDYCKNSTVDAMRLTHPQVIKILEGKSVDQAFGISQKSSNRFKEAEQYSTETDTKRRGGRQIPYSNPILMMHQFGITGVQFGNYVPDVERTIRVQDVTEALADLADILQWSDQQISLDGLGIAIGARGRCLAHYEPDLHVINLSRLGGAGTVSHESHTDLYSGVH